MTPDEPREDPGEEARFRRLLAERLPPHAAPAPLRAAIAAPAPPPPPGGPPPPPPPPPPPAPPARPPGGAASPRVLVGAGPERARHRHGPRARGAPAAPARRGTRSVSLHGQP